jgi:DNA-directed RNA polymerase
VELYSQPILESLFDSLEMRFPEATFPPVPARGALNLNDVRKSEYFFH